MPFFFDREFHRRLINASSELQPGDCVVAPVDLPPPRRSTGLYESRLLAMIHRENNYAIQNCDDVCCFHIPFMIYGPSIT